jgi:curli biogenesis system outer membrane secretion channel CsgG
MNMHIKKTKLIVFAMFLSLFSFAQKNVKTSFEKVKAICQDQPLDKRIRVTVGRFSVTTTAPESFGGNLTTMLTNALQGINCYRVLESLVNKNDMNDEIDYGEGKYAKKNATPQKGKQLGAQIIVTGEITEYSVKDNTLRIGIVKVGSNKAKIGFVLKVINPETRDILFSQSISVEGKTGGSTEVGLFGLNAVSSENSDPAVINACELGIIKAVEFLASKKDEMNIDGVPKNPTKTILTNETEITLNKTNFSNYNEFADFLTRISSYKSVEKTFKSQTAIFTITHTGNSNDFLDEVAKKLAAQYEVVSIEAEKMEIKLKKVEGNPLKKEEIKSENADLINNKNTLTNEISITLRKSDFNAYTEFTNLLATLSSFRSQFKTFTTQTATFIVTHINSEDNFINELSKKIIGKYEITNIQPGKIEIMLKKN